jgi:hypothetical protein
MSGVPAAGDEDSGSSRDRERRAAKIDAALAAVTTDVFCSTARAPSVAAALPGAERWHNTSIKEAVSTLKCSRPACLSARTRGDKGALAACSGGLAPCASVNSQHSPHTRRGGRILTSDRDDALGDLEDGAPESVGEAAGSAFFFFVFTALPAAGLPAFPALSPLRAGVLALASPPAAAYVL